MSVGTALSSVSSPVLASVIVLFEFENAVIIKVSSAFPVLNVPEFFVILILSPSRKPSSTKSVTYPFKIAVDTTKVEPLKLPVTELDIPRLSADKIRLIFVARATVVSW